MAGHSLRIWDELAHRWPCLVVAGGNVSSELAQKIAANNLANSYMAFNTNYHDTGLFGVYVTVSFWGLPVCLSVQRMACC